MPWPNREPETARDVRLSPLHDRAAAAGATFGTRNGWERPLFFGPPRSTTGGDNRRGWSTACRAAGLPRRPWRSSTRRRSPSTPSADPTRSASLQWVCADDVDVPVGQAVYTPWLNARGAYQSDVTVTRTGDDGFLVVSSAATTVRDLAWLDEHLGRGAEVTSSTFPATSRSSA